MDRWSLVIRDTHTDLGLNTIGCESLYCLPLLVRRQNPGPEDSPTTTDCLLLKPLTSGAYHYTRLGLFKVSLDLEHYLLPHDIRWIVECAKSDISSAKLVTVTIY